MQAHEMLVRRLAEPVAQFRVQPPMLERRGGKPAADCDKCKLDLSGSKRYLKSTAAKYAPAIESLRANPRPVMRVAIELGIPPESLRQYLHTHEPELVAAVKKAEQQEKSND